MGRQSRLLARALTLVALTVAFAGSTAVFNATYEQQAEVDARLTNGADVTVTESPGASVGPAYAARLARCRRRAQRRAAAAPLRLRRRRPPGPLRRAPGHDRRGRQAPGRLVLRRHGRRADAHAGARSRTACSSRPRPSRTSSSSRATCCGCACRTDAPRRCAPSRSTTSAWPRSSRPRRRDSFLVANAAYVAKATGSDAVGSFLVQTDGTSPADRRRARARASSGTGARSPTSPTQRRVVGSNLTAVELSGLTRVELAFALLLAIAATGLALALGFQERRRMFAIAAALGARRRAARRVRLERVGVRHRRRPARSARCWPAALSVAAGQGPDRRLRPAARHAGGALGLPRRAVALAVAATGRRRRRHAARAAHTRDRGAAGPLRTLRPDSCWRLTVLAHDQAQEGPHHRRRAGCPRARRIRPRGRGSGRRLGARRRVEGDQRRREGEGREGRAGRDRRRQGQPVRARQRERRDL